MKKNCWEVMKCGREPGGKNAGELGVCPATTDARLDAVHSGKNAGRACWVIAGTFCEGKVQGTFARKYEDCSLCEFFRQVRAEEGSDYQMALVLLKKLNVLK
ncbi:Metal dependent phosphohydrolase (fragment) [Candidatus Sulfobium mesophilum]|uniref:Metal dependent phosphohydrolase n=1 Tax=Candidatus Sulfobium mesophilum TaxID=2016548 RepID=A0A2U3QH18_9BACT